jgi:hypothetical protein
LERVGSRRLCSAFEKQQYTGNLCCEVVTVTAQAAQTYR